MKYVLVLLTFVLAGRAVADDFTIYPYLTGDRNDLGYYPNDEYSSPWSVLDDPGEHDGDTSYVWGIETAQYQGVKSRNADIPAVLNGTIDTVRVLIVGRNHTGTFSLAAWVDTIGASTEFLAPQAYFGTTFDSNWYAWTTCPWTGTAWTRQDLVDLEFGIRTYFPGLGDTAVITQCNVHVIWTPSEVHPGRRRRTVPMHSECIEPCFDSNSTFTERSPHEAR